MLLTWSRGRTHSTLRYFASIMLRITILVEQKEQDWKHKEIRSKREAVWANVGGWQHKTKADSPVLQALHIFIPRSGTPLLQGQDHHLIQTLRIYLLVFLSLILWVPLAPVSESFPSRQVCLLHSHQREPRWNLSPHSACSSGLHLFPFHIYPHYAFRCEFFLHQNKNHFASWHKTAQWPMLWTTFYPQIHILNYNLQCDCIEGKVCKEIINIEAIRMGP